MKKFLFIFLIIPLILFPGFLSADQSADFGMERLFYVSNLREKEGIESLKQHADKIDILAPQMYGVTSSLTIAGGLSAELREVIKENNMKVMPLIANSNFRQDVIHNLLTSPEAQDKIIGGLVYLAQKNNYIGWQFDFENINYLDRELFSQFVEKTAAELHKNNFILSVAVVIRDQDYQDTYFYKNWSGVFDYKRIADAVDFVSVMTYDDQDSKGPPASLPFVKKMLAYLEDKIPPEKLSMGIPLYYWGWTLNPLKKVRADGTYQRVQNTKANYFTIEGFDEDLGVPWYVYLYGKTVCAVFYENARSFELKLDLAKQNNFRGFSAWVLGIEDPAIWNSL